MGQYLMIREKGKEDNVFEFSRNSDIYFQLSQFLTFPYDKWAEFSDKDIEEVITRVNLFAEGLQSELLYSILTQKSYEDISEQFDDMNSVNKVIGQLMLVQSFAFWHTAEWCF